MNKKEFSVAHRLLHWAIAIGLMFMLITIFLRLNWMEKEHVGQIIQQQLTRIEMNITTEQAVKVAKAIRSPMWQWHLYIGYVLGGLFLLRLIFLFKNGIQFSSPLSNDTPGKKKFQAWIYIFFYVLLGITLFSGVMIVWGPDSIHDLAETIHKPALIWLLIFIVLHFAGLIIAELKEEKGIVSKMLYGKNLLEGRNEE